DPGAKHIVLGHDLEQSPRSPATAVLAFVVVEWIRLTVRKQHAGFFRLVVDADDDWQAYPFGPFTCARQRLFGPHAAPHFPPLGEHHAARSSHRAKLTSLCDFTC